MSFVFPLPRIIFGSNRADDIVGSDDRSDAIFSLQGDDVISALGGDDYVLSDGGNDRIDAGAGDDIVLAGNDDDDIEGGAGSDLIDGGRGFDRAIFAGGIADYTITGPSGWFATVTVGDAAGDEDSLTGVEALYFEADDYTLYLDGTNNAVLAADDTASTDEDAVLSIAASDLTANDQEFDGDEITVVAVSATSAAGASVSLANGAVSYDPGDLFQHLNDGETATDTFTYTVDDGKGGTDTATVTVTINGSDDTARCHAAHQRNPLRQCRHRHRRVHRGSRCGRRRCFGPRRRALQRQWRRDLRLDRRVRPRHDLGRRVRLLRLDLPVNGIQNGSPDGVALSRERQRHRVPVL